MPKKRHEPTWCQTVGDKLQNVCEMPYKESKLSEPQMTIYKPRENCLQEKLFSLGEQNIIALVEISTWLDIVLDKGL